VQRSRRERCDLLVVVRLDIAWQNRAGGSRLTLAGSRHASLARKTVARTRDSGWRLAVMMSHALRREIAFMHALCAVLARGATVLVDALGLALSAAHAGAAGPQRRAANNRRHGERNYYERRIDESVPNNMGRVRVQVRRKMKELGSGRGGNGEDGGAVMVGHGGWAFFFGLCRSGVEVEGLQSRWGLEHGAGRAGLGLGGVCVCVCRVWWAARRTRFSTRNLAKSGQNRRHPTAVPLHTTYGYTFVHAHTRIHWTQRRDGDG
jgi:hypothetical protein